MKIEFEIGKKTYGLRELLLVVTCICILLAFWVWSAECNRFAFQEQVNITGGFYRGQVGEIRDRGWFRNYMVDIGKGKYSSDCEWIKSRHLEPLITAEVEDFED